MTLYDWTEIPLEEMTPFFARRVIHTPSMTIAQLELKQGGHVSLHHHINEQVSIVVSGKLVFHIGGKVITVGPGQTLVIPPNLPHSVEVLEDAIVTDVFTPRREDWISGNDAYLRK